MNVVFSSIESLLTFSGFIGVLWTVIGLPVGIVLTILKKLKHTKAKRKTIFVWCFGGIVLLITTLVLNFIVSLIGGLLGIPYDMSLPKTP